ncbi:hypothetical protein M885DRAFT_529433 [Pelagophyceae sp. CCMP2097]|nr:hypothetical protein M885DRAFT_529433 [Pelagophyceae sp. CCMP2097]
MNINRQHGTAQSVAVVGTLRASIRAQSIPVMLGVGVGAGGITGTGGLTATAILADRRSRAGRPGELGVSPADSLAQPRMELQAHSMPLSAEQSKDGKASNGRTTKAARTHSAQAHDKLKSTQTATQQYQQAVQQRQLTPPPNQLPTQLQQPHATQQPHNSPHRQSSTLPADFGGRGADARYAQDGGRAFLNGTYAGGVYGAGAPQRPTTAGGLPAAAPAAATPGGEARRQPSSPHAPQRTSLASAPPRRISSAREAYKAGAPADAAAPHERGGSPDSGAQSARRPGSRDGRSQSSSSGPRAASAAELAAAHGVAPGHVGLPPQGLPPQSGASSVASAASQSKRRDRKQVGGAADELPGVADLELSSAHRRPRAAEAAGPRSSRDEAPAAARPGAAGDSEQAPSDGVYFAQYKGHPETLVVYRAADERAANPERLNLDRRHLTVCPILKSEERVRLLNYQNNYIEEIRHLAHLPNLIFLDLYNNCIEALSRDLEMVPTLRVLMLGKNRIKCITHLDKLQKLDVLDLHSNAISKVERLSALTELRVLNLAGNRLVELGDLGALQSLTELNVRRNQIERASSLEQLGSLQRVFLSNNKIERFEHVACLFNVRFLMELSLDGNPVALRDAPAYRRFAIERVKTLRHLDLKRITDAERRAVAAEAVREDDHRRAVEKTQVLEGERRKVEVERHAAIRAAELEWIDRQFDAAPKVSAARAPHKPPGAPPAFFADSHPTHNSHAPPLAAARPLSPARLAPPPGAAHSAQRPPGDANASHAHLAQSHAGADDGGAPPALPRGGFPTAHDNGAACRRPSRSHSAAASGYYEVEVLGETKDERSLQIYGEAWDCLDQSKILASSTALVCRFVGIEGILEKLKPHVKSFARLKSATFGDNAICTLRHVAQLGAVLSSGFPALVDVRIESNPACSLSLLRAAVACACPKLRTFNGEDITDAERAIHLKQLGPLCAAAASALAEAGQQWRPAPRKDGRDEAAHDAFLDGARRTVASAIANAARADDARRALEAVWPLAIQSIVDECTDSDRHVDDFFAGEGIWK